MTLDELSRRPSGRPRASVPTTRPVAISARLLRATALALALTLPWGALPASLGGARVAQAATKAEREAHTHYMQARDLYKAGRFEDALVALDKAYKAFPKPIILVKKAECYEKMDMPEEALEAYTRALEEERDPGSIGRIETARTAVSAILAQPIELSVVTSTPGAEVLVDGAPAGTAPVRVMLPRGTHTVVARKDGYRSQPQSVMLRGSRPNVVTLDLMPAVGYVSVVTDRGSFASHVVTLDDSPLELAPKEQLANWTEARPIAIGHHVVTCTFPGYRTYVAQVQVREDEVAEAHCNFAEYDAKPVGDYTWAWVTLSGAIASTGAGVFLVVSYYQDQQQAKDQNLGIETTKDDVGIALLSVGGALAGVSIWLFVDPPLVDADTAVIDDAPSPFQMTLLPMPSGGAVFGASGTF